MRELRYLVHEREYSGSLGLGYQGLWISLDESSMLWGEELSGGFSVMSGASMTAGWLRRKNLLLLRGRFQIVICL